MRLVGCWSVVKESLVLCFFFVLVFKKKKGEKNFLFKIFKKKKGRQLSGAAAAPRLQSCARRPAGDRLFGYLLFWFSFF